MPLGRTATDAELLLRFAESRDADAFELLVWRHRRMVHNVCRRVLHDRHEAEDATQATFLLLAKNAGHVRTTLGGWLYRVAFRCATRLRNKRKSTTDIALTVPFANEENRVDQDELRTVLDTELNRLPERYRVPIVLCYLQGKSYQEAAEQLGCPLGTLSGWLTRGKDRLRLQLVRRGLTLTAAAMSVQLAQLSQAAAESAFSTHAMTDSALKYLAGETIPSAASKIANEVSRIMKMKQLLTTTLACVGIAIAAIGAVGWLGQVTADDPPKPAANRKEAPAPKAKPDTERVQGEWIFDKATMPGGGNAIHYVWNSRMSFRDDTISLTNYVIPYTEPFVPELKSSFALDAAKATREIDIAIPKLAIRLFGKEMAGGPIRGIYRFDDDDTLTICLANRPLDPRPKTFDVDEKYNRFLFTVKRNKVPGAKMPAEVAVRFVTTDGKPVGNSKVTDFGSRNRRGGEFRWQYSVGYTTDANGVVPVNTQDFSFGLLSVRVAGKNLYATSEISPYRTLTEKPIVVTVRPGVRIHGKIRCPQLEAKKIAIGWTNVTLRSENAFLSSCISESGEYELFAPPGQYNLEAYGSYVQRIQPVVKISGTEPTQQLNLDIELQATSFGELLGKPAPELVVQPDAKKEAIALAKWKGKPVLLMFWSDKSFGKNDFTDDMLALQTTYTKYRERGLEVVLLVMNRDNEFQTAEEFIAKSKKARGDDDKLTHPYRIAIMNPEPKFNGVNGFVHSSQTMVDYGVEYSGFTVLIDRSGKVVGNCNPETNPADKRTLEAILDAK